MLLGLSSGCPCITVNKGKILMIRVVKWGKFMRLREEDLRSVVGTCPFIASSSRDVWEVEKKGGEKMWAVARNVVQL